MGDLGVGAVVATPSSLGIFNKQTLPNWRKGLSRVLGGTGQARIAWVGDSVVNGTRGDGTVKFTYSPAYVCAAMLNARGVKAQTDSMIGVHSDTINSAAAYNSYDPRVTIGASIRVGGTSFLVAAYNTFSTDTGANDAGHTLSFIPTGSWDTFDVYTLGYSGWSTGTLAVNVNGGATLATISSNASTTALNKTTVAAGSHQAANSGIPINVICNATSGYLHGIVAYDSTAPAVHMLQMGWTGSTAGTGNVGENWSINTYNWSPGTIGSLAPYKPDLTIIELGLNDESYNPGAANYQTGLALQLQQAQNAGGDCIIVVPWSQTNLADSSAQSYWSVAKSLAAQNNIPYIDFFPEWGTYTAANAAGFLGADNLHPTAMGQADFANVIATYLLNQA